MFNLSDYDYVLPPELIAREPATPRDSSRLFVYSIQDNSVVFDEFRNLEKYLPKESLIVLNKTKVVPARVNLKKTTGGKIEVLFLINEPMQDSVVKGLVDRKTKVGDRLYFDEHYFVKVASQKENIFGFELNFDNQTFFELLEKYGSTPIPKYLKGGKIAGQKLKESYQAVFAQTPSSVAAPTASLHFSSKLLSNLHKTCKFASVTLHVGLGTFAPITGQNFNTKSLHKEYYSILKNDAQLVQAHKKQGKAVLAVGTTTVRALESSAQEILNGQGINCSTDIFIFPPYKFAVTDALITNFHLPKSSLMCLVDAFLQDKGAKRGIMDLYDLAIQNKFRFYSFGDAMLIIT